MRIPLSHNGVIGLGLAICFCVVGVLTLPLYGLTWDESLGNLFFGERYLHYFTSFNPKYLDFDDELDIHRQQAINTFVSPFRDRPNEFPPLADTLSAATMYIFSYTLGWLNPVDGFHLFTVLLCSLLLGVMYSFAAPRLGAFPALIAVIALGGFPRFWADMHFNVKDVPETVFFGLTIIAFWRWYESPNWQRVLVAGLLMGAAMAVKANAVFIPVILFLSVLLWAWGQKEGVKMLRLFWAKAHHLILMTAGALGLYVLSWPYVYKDPIHRLADYWKYIFSQGERSGSFYWNIDPIRQVLTTMPEWMLVAVAVGVWVALQKLRKEDGRLLGLLLIWVIFPILRASMPGAVNFDGIRHFMEFVPAAALLAGVGVKQICDWVSQKSRVSMRILQWLVAGVIGINLLLAHSHFYPYQHLYYNTFTGGMAGAKNLFLGSEATDYWATTYRAGMNWLNTHAPQQAYLHTFIADWVVELSAPALLRPDLQLVPMGALPDFSAMRVSPIPYYLMFITRDGGDSADEIAYTQKHGQLVYEIVVDRVSVMQIYQFGGE